MMGLFASVAAVLIIAFAFIGSAVLAGVWTAIAFNAFLEMLAFLR